MTAVRPRIEWVLWPLVALAIVGVAVAGAAFLLTGGRFLIIRTPSMGEYAPVGTLVLSTVFPFARLRADDMIVFHPPGTAETYFHRVHSIAGGLISTKGDINGSVDPWRLTAHDIVGHEVAKFQGVGWVVQMHIDANGRFGLAIGPHLGVGEWIGLVALWLIPLGVSVGWAIFVDRFSWGTRAAGPRKRVLFLRTRLGYELPLID